MTEKIIAESDVRRGEERVYSVSSLTREVKELLEAGFRSLWIEGEVSNFKAYPSGHFYFSLKDDESVVNCVMFRSSAEKTVFSIKDGMVVLAKGRVSVYGKRGQYQLYVSFMEPKGKGALQEAFEQLKEKLKAEGLFDEQHKKPLPSFPGRVGIITSSSGAAINDILDVAGRRFPKAGLLIRPTQVQGEKAGEDIVNAIREMNEYNDMILCKKIKDDPIDVLIVGRGGGSAEDLWSFNEEKVARAVYGSKIPVVSAVGHEIDFTITDLVADLRAPTPSAAAEIVMPDKREIEEKIEAFAGRIKNAVKAFFEKEENRVEDLESRYILKQPLNMITQKQQRLDNVWEGLINVVKEIFQENQTEFRTLAGKMKVLNPLGVLERGYSITFKDGKELRDVSSLSGGDIVETRLAKGIFRSEVKATDIMQTD